MSRLKLISFMIIMTAACSCTCHRPDGSFQTFALAELTREHDADFIIATQINVCTQEGCFAVTVTGYPARYENFRQPTQEDLDMMWKAKSPGWSGPGGRIYFYRQHLLRRSHQRPSLQYRAGVPANDGPHLRPDG